MRDVDNPEDERVSTDDYIAQRAHALLHLALNFDAVPEDARDDVKAFMGAMVRSITPNDPATVSRLKKVQG